MSDEDQLQLCESDAAYFWWAVTITVVIIGTCLWWAHVATYPLSL